MVELDKLKAIAPVLVRLGISLVFLWFGFAQIFDGENFLRYLPELAKTYLPFEPLTIILFNGVFDALFGFLLLIGLFTRLAAAIMALHLLGVVINLGYNDIAVRDFGLMVMAVSIFLRGPDRLTADVLILEKMKTAVKESAKGVGSSLGDAIGIKVRMK